MSGEGVYPNDAEAETPIGRVIVLQGLPSLFDYVVAEVTARRQQDSFPIVIYHLLGDVTNAIESALPDYFVVSLDSPGLQNSSRGTPYQAWAQVCNESFEKVDKCMRRLMPAVLHWFDETSSDRMCEHGEGVKDAWHWFRTVTEEYACCVIKEDESVLILSSINLPGWLDEEGRFLPIWTQAAWSEGEVQLPFWREIPWQKGEPLPPIVLKSARELRDRSALVELRRDGLERLNKLRTLNARLAAWLCANYTMEQITAPHGGTLSDCWLGNRAL